MLLLFCFLGSLLLALALALALRPENRLVVDCDCRGRLVRPNGLAVGDNSPHPVHEKFVVQRDALILKPPQLKGLGPCSRPKELCLEVAGDYAVALLDLCQPGLVDSAHAAEMLFSYDLVWGKIIAHTASARHSKWGRWVRGLEVIMSVS